MCHQLISLLAVSVRKHVNIKYQLRDSLANIVIDQSQVQQIMMNLVMNASESIEPTKQGNIQVRTDSMYADSDYLSQTYFYGEHPVSGKYV